MAVLLSQIQKRTEKSRNVRVANKLYAALPSRRSQVIALATTTSLCLGLIGVGTVKNVTADDFDTTESANSTSRLPQSSSNTYFSQPATSVHKADVFSANHSPDAPGESQTKASVTINGQVTSLNSDGHVHKIIKDEASRSEVDITIDTNNAASTATRSSLEIKSSTRSSMGAE